MNNSENKDSLEKNSYDEASARAEKIKAIRESLRNAREQSEREDVQDNPSAANAAALGLADSDTADEQSAPQSAVTESEPFADAAKNKKVRKKKKKKKKPLKQKIRGLFPEKGDSVGEIIRKIVFLISIIAIIVCGYLVVDYYTDLWRSRAQYNDVAEIYNTFEPIEQVEVPTEPPKSEGKAEKHYTILDGARKLLDINSDTVGYLRIPSKDGSDPIVDLPVVQAHDNMKYLDRNFKGDESRTGTLFLDFRNSFDKVKDHKLVVPNSDHFVIYGHNMADESMFGKLKYYYGSADYCKEHPIIQLNSNYETYVYKIFAVFIVDAKDESETKYDCWNQLTLDSEEAFYNFVNEAKRRTIYTNEVDVKYGDSLLSLSTCHYLLQDRSRLMIMARSVRPDEELYEGAEKWKKNKNIKWPSMYYNTKTNEKYDEKAIFIPYGPEEAVKEAEAKLAAQKKKEEASKKTEKAKKTTAKKKKTDSSKTKSKTTKTTTVKTTAVKKTSAEE